jgi:hypothetical protein
MMRILASMVLVLFWWVSGAEAACSGSGQTWNCTAGTTSAQLSTTLNSAADGATLTFAAGSYSWNSFTNFSNTKGVTLVCETVAACIVNVNGTVLGMNGTLSGTTNKLYRISGFTFSGGSNFVIWFYGPGTMTQVRIDHNTFINQSTEAILFFGENSTVGNYYGLLDHNTVTNSGSIALFENIGGVNPSPPPSPFGTANNLFVEDNNINITTMTNAGLGCMDSWGGSTIVWRHNTTRNCLVTSHGATHAGGPANIELYDNLMIVDSGSQFTDCYRCFHHQGSGEFVAFNNRFTSASGKNGNALSMMDYRAYSNSIDGGAPICDGNQSRDGNRSPVATYRGYPCWHQPGRDFAGNLRPIYVWNNTWSDTGAKVGMSMEDLGGSPDYVPNHMQANRDYYNSVSASMQTSSSSPFNGTTGMGFGTLANRPSSCTTNSLETGGGVGYFATDQGPRGTLYRCSATDTWTVQYTPFPYPHPLATGGGIIPSAPTNLRVIRP